MKIPFIAAAVSLLLGSVPLIAAPSNEAAPWSASIGNGHTSENTSMDRGTSHGVPSSPHWSARIGTGNPTSIINDGTSAQQHQPAGSAHWSSKIGTGHASQSSERPARKASAVVADAQGE